jgi:hemerythrin-like metal-binding protein
MAAYIAWKDCYTVGDRLLDAQHREIFEVINRLYLPMQGATPGLAAERILDRLIRSTRTHFDHEEARQKETAFAQVEAHQALHQAMLQRMLDLRSRFTSLPAQEILEFLRDWWLTHIQSEDRKYVTYLDRVRVWDSNLLRC